MRIGYTAILMSSLLVGVVSCGDDADENGEVKQAIVVKSVTLAGSTSEAAAVSVDQKADADGAADTAWTATFNLDERKGPAYLPLDDGSARTDALVVKSVPTGAGTVSRLRVLIELGAD